MQRSEAPDVFGVDPGVELARAREARGLTRAQVAEDLRLSQSQVEALERGDESRLAGGTYVRGYVRAYARLVGLDPDELVARFERASLAGGASRGDGRGGSSARGGKSGAGLFAVAPRELAVAIALAALAIPWYLMEHSIEARNAAAAAEHVAAGGAGSLQAAGLRPGSAIGTEGLVLRLLGPSWIRVSDAQGVQLVNEPRRSGEIVQVDGRPPFSVFLGNARAVDVEYYGRVVDVPLRSDSLYARVRVDGAAAGPTD
jgi:cytoskeleton protein RodZ